MFAKLVGHMQRLTDGFCDLVLGPRVSDSPWNGHIVEVVADDPKDFERYIEKVLSNTGQVIALLGVDAGRWESHAHAGSVLVMPAETASQMLYAAGELIKSKAVDVIVIQEILLRPDASHHIALELRKLHALVNNSDVILALLNPNTSERKRILSELQIICSRQISIAEFRRF
jgi:hypothetical protein